MEIINLRRDVMSLAVMPVEFIKEKVGDQALMRMVKFDNIRQKKVIKIGYENYLLEIDKTEYNDGSVDYELELELTHTNNLDVIEDHLRKLFNSLDIPFEKQTKSKFHRALKKGGIL